MRKIIKEGQRFRRRVTTEAEALKELAHEPYKCELIGIKGPAGEEASVEVGGSELTIYDNLGRDGQSGMERSLSRSTSTVNQVDSRLQIDAHRCCHTGVVLRRIQCSKEFTELHGHHKMNSTPTLNFLPKRKRDHRRLGTELDLFSFPEEIGSGLAVFHPKGGIVRRAMEDYSRIRYEEENYEFVYSPHLTKAALFEISGHWQWYADGMYPPMILDEELNADGTVKKAGQQYYMKPMNCPFHTPYLQVSWTFISRTSSQTLSNLERSIVTRNQVFFTESPELVALHRMMPTFIAPKSRWWES
jgi:threonyl-tRNA synthetase